MFYHLHVLFYQKKKNQIWMLCTGSGFVSFLKQTSFLLIFGVGGCEEKKETTLVLCCGFAQCLNVKIKFLSLGVDNVWLV